MLTVLLLLGTPRLTLSTAAIDASAEPLVNRLPFLLAHRYQELIEPMNPYEFGDFLGPELEVSGSLCRYRAVSDRVCYVDMRSLERACVLEASTFWAPESQVLGFFEVEDSSRTLNKGGFKTLFVRLWSPEAKAPVSLRLGTAKEVRLESSNSFLSPNRKRLTLIFVVIEGEDKHHVLASAPVNFTSPEDFTIDYILEDDYCELLDERTDAENGISGIDKVHTVPC